MIGPAGAGRSQRQESGQYRMVHGMVATIAVAMVVACAPPGLRDSPWKRATATAVEGDRLPTYLPAARAGESEI